MGMDSAIEPSRQELLNGVKKVPVFDVGRFITWTPVMHRRSYPSPANPRSHVPM
jgi:hypothetical protein